MCYIFIYMAKLTKKSYKVSTANSNYVRYTCSKTPCITYVVASPLLKSHTGDAHVPWRSVLCDVVTKTT